MRILLRFRRRPALRQALSATDDPVAQLLEVAEEAVAMLERSDTEGTRGWAEAAVQTLDELAGEDLFVRKLAHSPGAARDFMELLAGDPEDLVGELIAQHQQASPALAEIIRAAGSGIVFLDAKKEAATAGRRAAAEALHEFRTATAAQLAGSDPTSAAAILAERTPRLRERIAAAKRSSRCPA